MVPGLIVDFTGRRKKDGKVWDFNDQDMAEEAEKIVKDKRAMLIIVSPICAVGGLAAKLVEYKVNCSELLEHRERHLEWCTRLCNKQWCSALHMRTFGHIDIPRARHMDANVKVGGFNFPTSGEG